MERDLVDRDSRPLSQNGRRHDSKKGLDSRSRSPSPNPTTGSTYRRYRQRSRSPLRQASSTGHSENDRRHSSRESRSRRHHRGHRGDAQDAEKERLPSRPANFSRRRDDRHGRDHSSSSLRKRDMSDREAPRPSTHRNQTQYRSSHADSSLPPQRSVLSPTPTPPNASVTRFSPPKEHSDSQSSPPRHHRRHHKTSPSGRFRGGTTHTQHSRRSRRRSSTRSSASLGLSRHRNHHHENASTLPYGARALSRWDFAAFEPLFAYYLELQKQLRISDLDEREVRGRWKSFVGRWNRGELAEGWYEPEMFLRVVRARSLEGASGGGGGGSGGYDASGQVMTPPTTGTSMEYSLAGGHDQGTDGGAMDDADDDDDDDEGWGPSLPGATRAATGLGIRNADDPDHSTRTTTASKSGPAIPSLQDLEHRRTLEAEERQNQIADLRLARRADRHEQKERLEEIAPRAEPGTRERMLEKRRAAADAAREMRDAAGAGGAGLEEMGDGELMGGEGEGGAEDYRRVLESMRRRKTERELRREEVARARVAEREERIRGYREREEETVDMLRELARQRFG